MDLSTIQPLPELIYQARRGQTEAKERLLEAKERHDVLKTKVYLRYLEDGKRHSEAQARAKVDDDVIVAKQQLNEAATQYDHARYEGDRLDNTFALALSLRPRNLLKLTRSSA